MILSIIISVCAIIISYFTFRKNYHADVQPIIVFYPVSNSQEQYTWYAKNVGRGPAQGVIIAGGNKQKDLNHEQAILFPTLMQNEKIKLGWDIPFHIFVAIYSNIYNKEFTSICIENKNSLLSGNKYKNLKANRPMWKLKKDKYSE